MESSIQSASKHCIYDVEEAADWLMLEFMRMHILAWQQDGPAKKAPKTATEQKKAGNPKPQGKVGANFTLLREKSTFLLV